MNDRAEIPFTPDEMYNADEIIVTSSGHLCLRAEMIDGCAAGNKDPETFERIRRELINEFRQATGIE